MSPKQLIQDTFEQLKGQASHSGQAMRQAPVDLMRSLLGDKDAAAEETGGGMSSQTQVDPRQAQTQAQISRLRRLDEMKRQEALVAIRKHGQRLKEWEMERRRREAQQQQAAAAQAPQETKEKQEKRQIKQLENREKAEVLSVKRAQTAVEARLGKF